MKRYKVLTETKKEKIRALVGAKKEKITATKYSLLKKQIFNLEADLISSLDFYKQNARYLDEWDFKAKEGAKEALNKVQELTLFIKEMEYEVSKLKKGSNKN